MTIFLLDEATHDFPPPRMADPVGLLAVGGDLTLDRLVKAYSAGIFPWFSEGDPVLWWSPDPRLVLYPEELKISASLRRVINKRTFAIRFDTAFADVITACATVKRKGTEGTWITADMIEAYCDLHTAGLAHSVEAWQDNNLVGGLYGVAIGRCFFGESMFSLVSNASKAALVFLTTFLKLNRFKMIDCQMTTAHLLRLGAREIPRHRFLRELEKAVGEPFPAGPWRFEDIEEELKLRR
jgi:leucyl/phenylalanyl-tRNA--protein transferase